MDGICTQCNIFWNAIPGYFCAKCGEELYVRSRRDGGARRASSAGVLPNSFDETPIRLPPISSLLWQDDSTTSNPAARVQDSQNVLPPSLLLQPQDGGGQQPVDHPVGVATTQTISMPSALRSTGSGDIQLDDSDTGEIRDHQTTLEPFILRSAPNEIAQEVVQQVHPDLRHVSRTYDHRRDYIRRSSQMTDSAGALEASAPMEGVRSGQGSIDTKLQQQQPPDPVSAPELPATLNRNHLHTATEMRVELSNATIPTPDPRRSRIRGNPKAAPELPITRDRERLGAASVVTQTVLEAEELVVPVPSPCRLRARDSRSRSPQQIRLPPDMEQHHSYRSRDRRRDSILLSTPPLQPAALTPIYCDSLPWHTFIDKFHQRYGNDALPTLQSFWEDFYQIDGVCDNDRPLTMLHIKDIAHRWILHLNQFEPWVREREDLLSEIAQYLEPRVGESCFRAWESQRAAGANTTRHYMIDLLAFAHNLHWLLIRKPLLGNGVKEPSKTEFSRHLFSIRQKRAIIQLDQKEYQICLGQLNQHRDRYWGRWEKITQRTWEDME